MIDGKSRALLGASMLAITAASPALAQDFYLGLGLSTDNDNFDDVTGVGDVDETHVDILAGMRFDGQALGSAIPFFLGVEVEHGFGSDHDTSRYRGLLGFTAGQADIFLSLGKAERNGSFNNFFGPAGGNINGSTYGLGVEYPVSGRFSGRFEVIRDDLEVPSYGTRWQSTTIRAGAIFKF